MAWAARTPDSGKAPLETGSCRAGSTRATARTGLSSFTNFPWMSNSLQPKTFAYSIFGLSEELTCSTVPAPGAIAVLASAGLLGRRRRAGRTRSSGRRKFVSGTPCPKSGIERKPLLTNFLHFRKIPVG